MTAPTTAAIMRRFNKVLQRHDPADLEERVAADCMIQKAAEGRAIRNRLEGGHDMLFQSPPAWRP